MADQSPAVEKVEVMSGAGKRRAQKPKARRSPKKGGALGPVGSLALPFGLMLAKSMVENGRKSRRSAEAGKKSPRKMGFSRRMVGGENSDEDETDSDNETETETEANVSAQAATVEPANEMPAQVSAQPARQLVPRLYMDRLVSQEPDQPNNNAETTRSNEFKDSSNGGARAKKSKKAAAKKSPKKGGAKKSSPKKPSKKA